MTEHQIQNEILRVYGTHPGLRLWRQNTGKARYISKGSVRTVSFGIPGQADLSGILPDGRRLEIEVKTADGRQSPEQRRFQAMIEKFNGMYILARSVEDVDRAFTAAGYFTGRDSDAD